VQVASNTRLVTVGNELLAGDITDINSPYVAQRAFTAGFPVSVIEVVPDDVEAIAQAVVRAVADLRASRIVVSGGVGPTHDDVTLEGVASGLGLPLELHDDVYSRIASTTARLHQAGRLPSAEVSPAHRRMAMAAAGAKALDNPRGLASPFAHSVGDDRWLFVLPGVPREFRTVVDDVLLPAFFIGAVALHSAEIRFEEIAESRLAPVLEQVEREFADVSIGSYPHTEPRELTIRARGTDPQRLAEALARIKELAPQ
jgi:molybdenum cofactor synthesis domain-containing protein